MTFLGLVLLLSLPFWVAGHLIDPGPLPLPLPISALQAIVPLVAAVLLTSRNEGALGVRRLLGEGIDPTGIRPAWYPAVLLTAPLVILAPYLVMKAVGRPLPSPEIDVLAAIVLPVLFLISAYTEQVGWTGYLTEPLQRRHGALNASLLIGLFWAAWHVNGWYFEAGNSLMWTFGQFATTVAWRVLIAWVYANTGSVLAAVLFHASINVTTFLFIDVVTLYEPIVTAAVATCAAATVTLLYGPRTLARFGRTKPA